MTIVNAEMASNKANDTLSCGKLCFRNNHFYFGSSARYILLVGLNNLSLHKYAPQKQSILYLCINIYLIFQDD